MAQQQRLDIRLGQNLVMTPQLRMAIQLLQMNTQDLQSFIAQEILENPFLANEDEGTETAAGDVAADETAPTDDGWDEMYDHGTADRPATNNNADDEASWEKFATSELTLRDHLRQQLGLTTADAVERFLGNYLIDAIDDAGYLDINFDQAASQLGAPRARLESVLKTVQGFEPTGVGARSLAECLELQLKAQGQYDDVMQIVLGNLDLLARRDLGKLARLAGVPVENIQAHVEQITHLTPKPGLKYGRDVSAAVVPELVVSRHAEGHWQVELNAEAMPKLLVNRHGIHGRNADEKSFVNEKMSRAQWLLKSLEQRAKTIYKVGQAIVQFQEDFFNYGVESLQPMTLKTVAEVIGSHESTVSRVTSGKHMLTPLGVFELKYFFSSALGTTGGNAEVAAESVKAIIKRLIKAEDATKPLSDEQLVDLLKKEGVEVARRTVAKYREALGIPSSSHRRVRL